MGGRGNKKGLVYNTKFRIIYTWWNGQTQSIDSERMTLGGGLGLEYIMEVGTFGWAQFYQVSTAWRIEGTTLYEWRSRIHIGSGFTFQLPKIEVYESVRIDHLRYTRVVSDPTWHEGG
jgi:hypothetical protein